MPFFTIIRFIFEETDKSSVLCDMDIRKTRELYREQEKGNFHFCTDGLSQGNIFNDDAQYALGMILLGLISIKYSLKIYAFTLMPNHMHIILNGTGVNCVMAFDYLKRKLSARLKRDGYRPLPEDYWFKLTRIEDDGQMKGEVVYVLRNPLEKGLAVVGGYLWSTGWLYYSGLVDLIGNMSTIKPSTREIRKWTGGDESVPADWRFHPFLGLHPGCFVDTSLVLRLFPDPKDLQTALVKDYELFFQIASRLGELCEFSKSEQESIVSQTLQKRFNGRNLKSLTEEERGKLAIILNREFGFNSFQISTNIYIKERIVRQLLASKELR